MAIINKNKNNSTELYNTKPFFEDETIDGKDIYNLSLIVKKDTTDNSVFLFKYYTTFIDTQDGYKETDSNEGEGFLFIKNKMDKEKIKADINKIIGYLAEGKEGNNYPQYKEKIELLEEYKRIYL